MKRLLTLVALSVLWACPVWAATARVQVTAIGQGFFDGLSTVGVAFTTQNTTAGNLIVAGCAWNSTTTTLTSVTDGGDTFTLGTAHTGNGWTLQGAYAKNIAGGSKPTITCTLSTTATLKVVAAHEVSGADTTAPLDGDNGNANGFQAIGATLNTGSVTTTANGDYIFAMIDDPPGNGGTMSAGSGFSIAIPSNNTGQNQSTTTEDEVQGTAGAINPSFTDSTASNSVGLTMAFKPASGGGGSTPPTLLLMGVGR